MSIDRFTVLARTHNGIDLKVKNFTIEESDEWSPYVRGTIEAVYDYAVFNNQGVDYAPLDPRNPLKVPTIEIIIVRHYGDAGNSLARNDPDDPLAIGDADAPVVLIEWADMRCPFCAAVANDTLPTIIDEYVETGKVRIEFHDVAFFGDESARASAAVHAAAAQGRGMEYVQAVFAVAPPSGHPELPEEQLIEIAEQVGVADIDAFTQQLRAPEGTQNAQQATAIAQQIGVNAVPFFFDGSVALSGAQPLDTFRSYLDEAVAAAQ